MATKMIYERFIWFDAEVRRKRYPNASHLAGAFEVSEKTAQRDIDFMRDRLGCPLVYDASRKGYLYGDEAFSLPFMHLSSAELSSLLIARKLLRDVSGGCVAAEIGSAVSKITSIIRKHASGPESIDEALSFHLVEHTPVPEEIFRTVLQATLDRKTLSFVYSSPARGEIAERTLDPYHLFNYMGSWHVVGYCHRREGIRDFRINRMGSPRLLDRPFTVQRGFNAAAYFRSSFGLYKGKETRKVLLRFTPEKARWIGDQIWHREQKTTINPDGSLELSFPVADFSEIAREVLKHGAGVEVLKPDALRKIVREEAEKIVRIYG